MFLLKQKIIFPFGRSYLIKSTYVLNLQRKVMNMVYPDEFNKCIINVGSLWQEKATSRAEFMEEI